MRLKKLIEGFVPFFPTCHVFLFNAYRRGRIVFFEWNFKRSFGMIRRRENEIVLIVDMQNH